jgi:hypothetical protein
MNTQNNRLSAGLAAVSRDRSPAAPAVPVISDTTPQGPTRRVKRQRWDERVQRATFHIDVALVQRLNETAERTGISKSEIVREAILRRLNELDEYPR